MIAANLQDHMLRTYASLRRLLAWVTIGFLLILAGYRFAVKEGWFSDTAVRNSISAYYYHDNSGFPMKTLFDGVLFGVGLLLIAYQGYTSRENWTLNFAGVFLLLVVTFPMDWPPVSEDAPFNQRMPHTVHAVIHYLSAIGFFVGLAYVCLARAKDTLVFVTNARRRAAYQALYHFYGICMLFVPVLGFSLYLRNSEDYLYIVECAGVFVFWMYWVTKSNELAYSELETKENIRMAAASPQAGSAA